MSQLVEPNVGQDGESHEEDKRGIEEDQTSLANVCVVQEHQTSSSDAGWQGVTRLPHDHEDNWNCKSAESSGHGTVCDIGNFIGDVRVANVLEQEVALVTDKPTSEGEEKLSERRVDIEEVCALQIVRSELELAVSVSVERCGCRGVCESCVPCQNVLHRIPPDQDV